MWYSPLTKINWTCLNSPKLVPTNQEFNRYIKICLGRLIQIYDWRWVIIFGLFDLGQEIHPYQAKNWEDPYLKDLKRLKESIWWHLAAVGSTKQARNCGFRGMCLSGILPPATIIFCRFTASRVKPLLKGGICLIWSLMTCVCAALDNARFWNHFFNN